MRCRMRCGDIWRCGGPIKKHVPVENVSIVGWSSTMSFEAQAQPYYVNYSIDVSPETATNKNVTIVSSNPEVINVSAYDSNTVTFSIEGDGEATITITSQDNPEINTTYSVTITPPEPPFAPTNSILVEPTRGNAILKFFAIDGESVDYVQARLGTNNKLTYVAYYGKCEGNTYCEEIFNNEDIKTELGAKIGGYIDTYGIPASGVLEFAPDMWTAIEGFFQGEQTIEDVISAIEEGEAIEPSVCRVTITANNPERARRIQPSEIDGVYNGTLEVRITGAGKGTLRVDIEGDRYRQTDVRPNAGYMFDRREINGVEASMGDVITLKGDVNAVGFLVPALESITISDEGVEEMTLGITYYFPYTSSPSEAPVKQLFFEVNDSELANISIDNGNVVVEPLQEGQVSFYLYDAYTGVQSNTLTFDITGGGGGSCPVTFIELPETYDIIELETQDSISFMTTYDCDTPDYSALSVTSDDESILTVDETYWEDGYINITGHADGVAYLTFTDANGDHIVAVNVGNTFYPQDGYIELQDNESDGARGDYGFSYTPETLTITAELDGEPLDGVEISTYDGEEGDEFPYRVSVLLPYGSEVRENFNLVFNDETLGEVARWEVYANVGMRIENPRPDLGSINWVAEDGEVFALDAISVDESGTLKYGSEDIVSVTPLAGEIVGWMNTLPEDPSYPDVRFIPAGSYEVNQTEIPTWTLLGLEPVWEETNQYAILYPRLPNVTSGEPITLHVGQSNPVRYLYHAENAMDFSRISATVTDENIATVEVMSGQYGEGEVIVRGVSEGYTEFYLEYYDETRGISITTDIIGVNVTN